MRPLTQVLLDPVCKLLPVMDVDEQQLPTDFVQFGVRCGNALHGAPQRLAGQVRYQRTAPIRTGRAQPAIHSLMTSGLVSSIN